MMVPAFTVDTQHTQGVVHLQALEQIAQGNFGGLGPGFDSGAYNSARSNENRYSRVNLSLNTLVIGFSHVDAHAEYEVGGERWGLVLSEYKCVCVW